MECESCGCKKKLYEYVNGRLCLSCLLEHQKEDGTIKEVS